jgi:hypothetical protein
MSHNYLLLAMRLDAAVMAAPYMHPRLKVIVPMQNRAESELRELLDERDDQSRGLTGTKQCRLFRSRSAAVISGTPVQIID